MLGNLLTRRATLVSLAAFAAGGLSGCNTTPSAGLQPVAASGVGGAISVDTSPLVAYVGNPTAGWVQQSLPGALARVLGPATALHVRIDTLYLGNGGPDERRRDPGRQDDQCAGGLDLLANPDRPGAAGTGAAGPRAGVVCRLRLPAKTKNGGLRPQRGARLAAQVGASTYLI
jgi:hypothetical protein